MCGQILVGQCPFAGFVYFCICVFVNWTLCTWRHFVCADSSATMSITQIRVFVAICELDLV